MKKRKNGVGGTHTHSQTHRGTKRVATNRSILNRDSLFFSTVVTFLIHVKPSVAEAHMYTESKALKKVDFDFGEKMKLSRPATKKY